MGLRRKKTAESLSSYQKSVIFTLARIYEGALLEKRLKELRFCTYEAALEVLAQGGAAN